MAERIVIELTEDQMETLEDCVASANESPRTHVTNVQFVQGIVDGYLESQDREEMVFFTRRADIAELKNTLGKPRDIRQANRQIKQGRTS